MIEHRWSALGAGSMAVLLMACSADRGVDRPTPMFSESPVEYPLSLWDQGIEGRTLVKVLVTEEGKVDSVVVVESSGHSAFDSAAVAGARKLDFQPAQKGGEPVRVWARVPVHFSKKSIPPPGMPPVFQPMAEGGGG